MVGDPFGPFTCVVGPNGCGKSVVVSGVGRAGGPPPAKAAWQTACRRFWEAAHLNKSCTHAQSAPTLCRAAG